MSDGRVCLLVARGGKELSRIHPDFGVFGQSQAQDFRAGGDRTLTEKRDPLDGGLDLVRPGADLLVGIPEGVVVPDDSFTNAVIPDPLVVARRSGG